MSAKPSPAALKLSPMDRLMTRPEAEPLPTALDPAGPEAHGYPADPKPCPVDGQDGVLDDGTRPGDIGRSA